MSSLLILFARSVFNSREISCSNSTLQNEKAVKGLGNDVVGNFMF